MKPFCGYVIGIWGSKGGREQRGSKQVAWIESFSQIWGLFQGFGAFSGIWGLFGDSGPFRGFAAFSGIRGLFADSRPFCRFAAFSQIRSLFADSRIHGQGSEGSEQATWRNFRYLIFFCSIATSQWANINVVMRFLMFLHIFTDSET